MYLKHSCLCQNLKLVIMIPETETKICSSNDSHYSTEEVCLLGYNAV
jgi:hypothetical protein